MVLFTFAEYWWFYLSFTAFVLVILFLDLGVFHKKAHEVSFKEASAWTVVWISLALIFNLALYFFTLQELEGRPGLISQLGVTAAEHAKTLSLEFLAGFIVEKSLAIDNIFIFALVFSYFQIPKIYQHRILFWGILGALIFRAIFIALGSYLMQYQAVVLFFGVVLVLTGIKMFFAGNEEKDLNKNVLIRLMRKFFNVHPKIEGQQFFLKKDGRSYVTPLFLALLFLEMSDLIFAIDSVPAIFALTKEPLIVFTSNIFAILGLRSMFFMLTGFMDRFALIKYGLASVLIFVGLKMSWLNPLFDGHFPTLWSLGIIITLIGGSILASFILDRLSPRPNSISETKNTEISL